MKKIIFTIMTVFALTFVNAQTKDKKGGSDSSTSFGVKGGLNMSTITGPSGYSSAFGIHIGGLVEFKLSSKFAVQPELLYSMQGAKGTDPVSDFKSAYINIPVMVKYFVTDDFSIQAGPQLGFLMSASQAGVDVKDATSSTDFGFNLGVGYNLSQNMMLDLRYNLGLSKLNKNSVDGTSDSKNSVISLGFGYKFN